MDEEPLVSVVRGEPTPAELAALVTVLAAVSSKVDDVALPPASSAWARSSRPSMGSGSWTASGRPR